MSAPPLKYLVVKSPFPSLYATSGGGSGLVHFVNDRIAFKFPWDWQDPPERYVKRAQDCAKHVAHEKTVHELLMKHPHPNIIKCLLIIPEGFFMERMPTTLKKYIEEHQTPSQPQGNDEHLHTRWIRQLVSALAWLESLGIVHGDLRPENILLSAANDIRIADFDTSVKIGVQVEAVTEPYCKLEPPRKHPVAGPATEQFALASCIYSFRFGHIPFHELNSSTMIRNIMRNELPSTAEDTVYGQLIEDCWRGKYETMRALDKYVKETMRAQGEPDECVSLGESPGLGHGDVDLVAQCHEFLEEEKKLLVLQNERKAARLREAANGA